jgi:hypothetical protein
MQASGGVSVPAMTCEVSGFDRDDAIARAKDWSKSLASGNLYRFALWAPGPVGTLIAAWRIEMVPTVIDQSVKV